MIERKQTSPTPISISRTVVKSNMRSREQATNSGFSAQPQNEKRRRYIPNRLFNEQTEDAYETANNEYLLSAEAKVKKPRSNTANAANAKKRESVLIARQNFS